jgi:anti-sigma-K factor RskA
MKGHEQIEELLAMEALGALDDEDAPTLSRALAEHGPDCAECAQLRRELGEVAGRLAFALDPASVREEIQEDILRAGPSKPLRRVRMIRPGLVAAAAAILVAVGAVGGYLLAPRQQPEIAELARFLARSDVRVVRFDGDEGNLAAAVAPREGYLFGSNLPALPEGRTYELWMIRGQSPVKGLCLEPREGVVLAGFQANLAGSDALAVTVESASCPSQPTTDPIFLAPLEV